CRTPGDVRALFPHARLVVKNAEIGATEFSGEEHTFVPGPVVDVVEVGGAGDAFAAGYLTALLRGAGPAARLQAGHDQAAAEHAGAPDFGPTRGIACPRPTSRAATPASWPRAAGSAAGEAWNSAARPGIGGSTTWSDPSNPRPIWSRCGSPAPR